MSEMKPTARQLEFLKDEIGIFFHFGIRTFNEKHRDWDMLAMTPASFNPTELDCDQWIRTAKAAGAKYTVMTTKHHDGFALWPSAYTNHSVKSSPWKNGEGDVVREYVDACRRHGMKVGLYYSCAQFDTTEMAEKYDDFVIGQVRELLLNYGHIDYLWFDSCGSQNHDFDRARIAKAIDDIDPELMIFGGFGRSTVRWIGNEWGHAHISNSNETPAGFMPGECDFCITRYRMENFWFYNETHNNCRRTLDELVAHYYYTVGRGANMLLNVAPDRRGLIEEEDVRLLTAFRAEISRRTKGCALIASAPEKSVIREKPAYKSVMNGMKLIDHVIIEEDLTDGEHVKSFSVEVLPNPDGTEVVEVFIGKTIGNKRICTFPAIRCTAVRVIIEDGDGNETIRSITPLYVGSTLGERQIQG